MLVTSNHHFHNYYGGSSHDVLVYHAQLSPHERDALVQLLNLASAINLCLQNRHASDAVGTIMQKELEHLLGIVQPALWDSLDMRSVPCRKDTD